MAVGNPSPFKGRLAMVSWKGMYFALALFLGSFFGSIFMLGPFLPLMFISPAWYRWITDCIVATWLTLPVALLEMVCGAKVVVTGDGFVPGERSVIIMNHRTRMDWMFLWNCLLRYSYLRLEKICLKSSLKSIPGFENTKARSNEFAEKNGLKKYKYVLHPRTTGFTFVVERLRKGNNLDAIHDITVAYPQNIPQTEKHLLKGNFPKEIHFHVRRYPIETVPTSKEELQRWCRQRWEEKEERLRRFYEGGRCFSAAGKSIVPPCKSELRVLAVKCASLLYWTVFPLGMLALLYLYSFAQWYFVAMIVFFVVQQKIFGGLELIELACHQYFKKQQKFHNTKVKIN
ncbi:lysocardiolipin acyltransferase 1 isoform X3 [Haemorhous mexicanus]|uniref:lysocardiolipin acyltransferase 1 isoform X3 n=1 Tax=Haemorhous mexicanus TaxID=30427 RepID=UPI0028BECFB1|nr:lysocardiolipin acyltransferase 1 isoform X3 [Haemorhous mexicanus]